MKFLNIFFEKKRNFQKFSLKEGIFAMLPFWRMLLIFCKILFFFIFLDFVISVPFNVIDYLVQG